MKSLYYGLTIFVISVLLLASVSCEKKEGPAEKAGKKIDETVEKVEGGVNGATDKMDEMIEEGKDHLGAENVEKKLNNFTENIDKSLKSIAESTNNYLKRLSGSADDTSEEAKAKIDSSVQNAINSIDSVIERAGESIESAISSGKKDITNNESWIKVETGILQILKVGRVEIGKILQDTGTEVAAIKNQDKPSED